MGQAADPFLGKVLAGEQGTYRLEEVVGKGSMARVYRAVDLAREGPCAVKVLRERRMDPELISRFHQEAKLGSSFRHENVVSVRDHGLHEGRPFLVMDLVDGRTLDELVRERRLDWRDASQLVAMLARTLAEAHQQGILHRDVKPSNVFVTREGRVLLMDFGLAKDTTRQDLNLTYQGELLGTPSYMSPEQARGQPADKRSDVHALGVILYELLTRRLPYPSDSVDETLRLLRESTPPTPRELEPSIPPPLEAVVLRAMAREPAQRTDSCARLADELESVLAGGSGAPSGAPTPVVVATIAACVLSLAWLVSGWLTAEDDGAASGAAGVAAPPSAARPRHPTGNDPGRAKRDELQARLEAAPEDAAGWLELAKLELDRGNLTGCGRALDELVERGRGAELEAAIADLRRRMGDLRATHSQVFEQATELRRHFETGMALRRVQAALRTAPDSPLLRSIEAELLADHGRWQAALEALATARALDPTLGPSREIEQAITAAAELPGEAAPEGAPLWQDWDPFLGGAWRGLPPDAVSGAGTGLGIFGLCGLVSRADRIAGDRYRLRVELSLEQGRPGPYGGILFGAASTQDFFVAYLFHDPREALQAMGGSTERLERYRQERGAWPKFVRLARMLHGEWHHMETRQTAFTDRGFVALEVEAEGERAKVLIDGEPAADIQLPRRAVGRVGVAKFYDTALQLRGWRADAD